MKQHQQMEPGRCLEVAAEEVVRVPSDYEIGVLVGVLVGEGHFGGDGRQPHVTLRMNVRHSALFEWIERTFPGGRLYGPYHHGGRHYFQWMARGAYLKEELLPLLAARLTPELDEHAHRRFAEMCERYGAQLGLDSLPPSSPVPPRPSSAAPSPQEEATIERTHRTNGRFGAPEK